MTQEEKELLLKDLCARLPYGVKICYIEPEYGTQNTYSIDYIRFINEIPQIITKQPYSVHNFKDIKPYLRPMSSMTDAEIKEIQKINWQFNFNKFDNSAYVSAADDGFCSVKQMDNILEYLNRHHFDYRGLIEKGLAIEVTEENNPYKE